jgi:hypothetical protein
MLENGGRLMAERLISARQMKRLQTLWGLFCRQAKLDPRDRAARLGWIGGVVGRQLGSFSELTGKEAETAIDAIQKHLPPELLLARRRARPGRGLAQAYGTAGRRGKTRQGEGREVRLIDAETWKLIDLLLTRLGWSRERLDGFLRSAKSPVRSGVLRTLAEANRVIWVLKSLLRRAEASTQKSEASPASNAGAARPVSSSPLPASEEEVTR